VKKLLIEEEKKVDWKHDYYAEKFFEVSGSLLDPIDRDNISFFWSQKDKISKLYSEKKIEGERNKKNKYENFGVIIFLISTLLLLLRTFLPHQIINNLTLIKYFPFFEFDLVKNLHFDTSFLPITISLILWSWYVTSLFRRLLSGLEEKKRSGSWFLSYFVALWSLICVLGSVIYPQSWLCLTGIGGFVVGLKYWKITKVTKEYSVNFDEGTFKRLWKATMINSVLLIIIFGPAYALIFEPFSIIPGISGDILGIITYIVSIVMIYFASYSIIYHISYARIPTFLGIFKRYQIVKMNRTPN